MADVVWAEQALLKLDAIVAYIEQFDPVAASKMRDRLVTAGESLADFPRRGRPTTRGFRELAGVPPYVIRYFVQGDRVIIARIRHGRPRPTS